LCSIAAGLERLKNTLNWTHPRKTQIILYGMLAAVFCIWYILPVKLILITVCELPFFAVFIPKEGGGPWKLGNLLTSVPDDVTNSARRANIHLDVPSHSMLRLERLEGAVCSGYLKHAKSKKESANERNWAWRFFTLDEHGSLKWWSSSTVARARGKPDGKIELRMSCCVELVADRAGKLHEQWLSYLTSQTSDEKNAWLEANQLRQQVMKTERHGAEEPFHFFSILGPFLHPSASGILSGERMHFFGTDYPADRQRWCTAISVFAMDIETLQSLVS
jgi:hypothetical protein